MAVFDGHFSKTTFLSEVRFLGPKIALHPDPAQVWVWKRGCVPFLGQNLAKNESI